MKVPPENDGIIAVFADKTSQRYYDMETNSVAYSSYNEGDIVEIVAFHPDQIKSVSNKNPTNSNNINEETDQ